MDDRGTMPEPGQCPECGARTMLVPLGARIDYPRPWLRWARVITRVYACTHCDAIVEVREIRRVRATAGLRLWRAVPAESSVTPATPTEPSATPATPTPPADRPAPSGAPPAAAE